MCKIGKRYSNEQLLLLSAFVVALLVDTTRIASRQEDLPRLMRDPVAVNSRKSNSLDESFPKVVTKRGSVLFLPPCRLFLGRNFFLGARSCIQS